MESQPQQQQEHVQTPNTVDLAVLEVLKAGIDFNGDNTAEIFVKGGERVRARK